MTTTIGIVTRKRQLRQSGPIFSFTAATPYTGPGDIVSGALAWWGLRAYNRAQAGTKAVNLRRDSDNSTQDFNTLSNGNLDVVSISSFKGAANLFVTKLYDQSGNSRDISQATAANQPSFTLSGLGTLPTMTAVDVSSQNLNLTTSDGLSQPCTFSDVANFTETGNEQIFLTVNNGAFNAFIRRGWHITNNNRAYMYQGGTSTEVTESAGSWHATQSMFNGASGSMFVDGTSTAVTVNTNNIPGAAGNFWTLFAIETGGTGSKCSATEAGIWSGNFTSGQQSTMNSNQHNYWGF